MHDQTHLGGAQAHGGAPVNLYVDAGRAAALRRASRDWPSWDLTPSQLADAELLMCGAYSPLSGFMTRRDYDSVCREMRLASGLLWPEPIVLDVTAALAAQLCSGGRLALRDPEGAVVAALRVDDVWETDQQAEADVLSVAGSEQSADVGRTGRAQWHVGGRLEGIAAPVRHDFTAFRVTPSDVGAEMARRGWSRAVAFAPPGLMHRAEVERSLRAMEALDAGLIVHVTAGSRHADPHYYSRMRAYSGVMSRFPAGSVILVLSSATRSRDGARALLRDAVLCRNFGATHMLLPEPLATPAAEGQDAGAARQALRKQAGELGLAIVDPPPPEHREAGATGPRRPGVAESALREHLERGDPLDDDFTYPEVMEQLRLMYPARHTQGLTIFFTGLSGSGKSTLANAVRERLLEIGGRPVTLLDGDLVRKHLSSELGFSREHRALNVRRIGYVASEITRSGGVAICALIAPHDGVRQEVRQMIEAVGGFVLVHVATPLEVCEARDRKGLYAKARAGLLPEFTGISDSYDVPDDAELTIDTGIQSVASAAAAILDHLRTTRFLEPAPILRGQTS